MSTSTWMQYPTTSNRYIKTYFNGFVDISGGDLFLRGGEKDNNYSNLYIQHGDISLNGRLMVKDDVSFNNRLTVFKDVSLNSRLFVGGDVSINSRLFVGSDAIIFGRLSVNEFRNDFVINTTTTNYTMIIAEDISLNGRLTVVEDVSLNKRLFLNGDASFNSRLFVYSDANMKSRFFVEGDVSLNQRAFIFNTLNIGSTNTNSYYALDVSGIVNLRGKANPITFVDNSVLLTASPDYDISSNLGNLWSINTKSFMATWKSIAISATGQYQIACTYCIESDSGSTFSNKNYPSESSNPILGYIFVSNDYGLTWNKKIFSKIYEDNIITYGPFWSVAISSDGKYQTATIYRDESGYLNNKYYIFFSYDYGNTFNPKILDSPNNASTLVNIKDNNPTAFILNKFFYSNAISSNGEYQVILQYITSVDYGATSNSKLIIINNFTKFNNFVPLPYKNLNAIAISGNGQYITITQSNITSSEAGNIYISNNYGINFSLANTPNSNALMYWNKIAMSSSGQYQVASVNGGSIYISNDYGNNWSISNSPTGNSWSSVAMSSSGQFAIASIYSDTNSFIYISNNYGKDWYQSNAPSGYWNSVSISSNGKYITACGSKYVKSQNPSSSNTPKSVYNFIYNSITPFSNISISNILNVYNDTSLNNRLFVGGDTSLNSRLVVSQDCSFNNRLFVSNAISINTTAATNLLTIQGEKSTTLANIQLYGGGSSGNVCGINFDTFNNRSGGPATIIRAIDNGNFSSDLTFWTAPASLNNENGSITSLERMRILANGNVNINHPTNPKLYLNTTNSSKAFLSGIEGYLDLAANDGNNVTLFNNNCSLITNWTISNISVGTVSSNTCFTSSSANSYAYINTNISTFTNKIITFNIYLQALTTTNTTSNFIFFFGCNSTGNGQIFQFSLKTDTTTITQVATNIGFSTSSSWTNYTPPTNPVSLLLTASTWLSVTINIDIKNNASISIAGTTIQSNINLSNLSGNYIGMLNNTGKVFGLNNITINFGNICNVRIMPNNNVVASFLSNGSVGIGSTIPLYKLDIASIGNTSTAPYTLDSINIYNDNYYSGDAINFRFKHGTGANNGQASIQSYLTTTTGLNSKNVDLRFYTTNQGVVNSPALTLQGYNNFVGICTTQPVTSLHLNAGHMFIGDTANCSSGFSTTVPTACGSSTTGSVYRLFFDNLFNENAGSGTAANKIVLHNNNWTGGFGIESNSVTYHSGGAHTFYTNSTTTYGNPTMKILNGAVGIRTTAPTAPLTVYSNSDTSPENNGIYCYNPTASGTTVTNNHAIICARTNGNTGGNPFFSLDILAVAGWSIGIDNNDSEKLKIVNTWDFNTTTNTKLTINTAGNVGIGTASPSYKLHVIGDIYASGLIRPSIGSGDSNGIIFPVDPGGGNGDAAWIKYYARNGEDCNLEIGTNNDSTDHIYLKPSGNVGINTSIPAYKLSVEGDISGNTIYASTPSTTENSRMVATTAYVKSNLSSYALSTSIPNVSDYMPKTGGTFTGDVSFTNGTTTLLIQSKKKAGTSGNVDGWIILDPNTSTSGGATGVSVYDAFHVQGNFSATGTITLPDNCITNAMIVDNAVTTAVLAGAAVTQEKVYNGYCDKTSNQTIDGSKTFSSNIVLKNSYLQTSSTNISSYYYNYGNSNSNASSFQTSRFSRFSVAGNGLSDISVKIVSDSFTIIKAYTMVPGSSAGSGWAKFLANNNRSSGNQCITRVGNGGHDIIAEIYYDNVILIKSSGCGINDVYWMSLDVTHISG